MAEEAKAEVVMEAARVAAEMVEVVMVVATAEAARVEAEMAAATVEVATAVATAERRSPRPRSIEPREARPSYHIDSYRCSCRTRLLASPA